MTRSFWFEDRNGWFNKISAHEGWFLLWLDHQSVTSESRPLFRRVYLVEDQDWPRLLRDPLNHVRCFGVSCQIMLDEKLRLLPKFGLLPPVMLQGWDDGRQRRRHERDKRSKDGDPEWREEKETKPWQTECDVDHFCSYSTKRCSMTKVSRQQHCLLKMRFIYNWCSWRRPDRYHSFRGLWTIISFVSSNNETAGIVPITMKKTNADWQN